MCTEGDSSTPDTGTLHTYTTRIHTMLPLSYLYKDETVIKINLIL